MGHKNKQKLNSETVIEKKINPWLFYVILVILVATNIISFIFYLKSSPEPKGQSISTFINPVRNFVDKKDMIVNFQSLREEINTIGANNSDISIYFEFLNTGANISANKDAEFFPASLSKLPLAMTVVKKIEKGEWRWENELVLMPTDKDERFGELYKQPIGTRFTI